MAFYRVALPRVASRRRRARPCPTKPFLRRGVPSSARGVIHCAADGLKARNMYALVLIHVERHARLQVAYLETSNWSKPLLLAVGFRYSIDSSTPVMSVVFAQLEVALCGGVAGSGLPLPRPPFAARCSVALP